MFDGAGGGGVGAGWGGLCATSLPHLWILLPFAPLIFHLSLILALFYISIRRLLLLVLTGERACGGKEGVVPFG